MELLGPDSSESQDFPDLKDFLYIDSGRIASYYAQLFEGNLSSVSRKKTTSSEFAKNRETNAKVLKFSRIKKDLQTDERLENIDPHHANVLIVLSNLDDCGYVGDDIDTANAGSLVLLKGTLYLYDGETMSQLIRLIDSFPSAASEMDENALTGIAIVRSIIGEKPFPSGYRLEIDGGKVIAGLLQDGFMIDTPTSYSMRYSSGGMENVYVIGIVERVGPKPTFPTQMLAGMQLLSEGFRNIYFNEGDTGVIPLAIFKTLERVNTISPT